MTTTPRLAFVNGINANRFVGWSLLLVSPSGDSEVLMGSPCDEADVSGRIFGFDQQSTSTMPLDGACPDGTYRPTDRYPANDYPFAGLPGAQHTHNLDNFNNENANGIWRLYADRELYDPKTTDRMNGGWSLSIETGPVDLDLPAGNATDGPASPYPSVRTVSGYTGLIADLNVRINGIFHTNPDDIEIMLDKVGGPRVMLMSDACGSFNVNAYGWLWDDEAPAPMPDQGTTDVCGSTAHRPTDHNPGDSLPSPAPPPPYGTSLSAFDLIDPNGEWRLWVADDTTRDEGFFTNRFSLEYTIRPRAATAWSSAQVSVPEGGSGTLTVTRSGATAYTTGSVKATSTAGTAGAGDFAPVSQTISFAPGETTKSVSVSIPDDSGPEASESFTVTLSAATGDARLVSPSTATVTIPASDGADGGSVDTQAPETTIVKAPKPRTPKSRTKIVFVADEAGVRFDCRLDKRKWKPCASPTRLKNLAPGRHRFQVRAADLAGNVEAKAAVVRWRVLR